MDGQRMALPFEEPTDDGRWVARATWVFVGVGLALRIVAYLLNFPLWWDEAFVAVNLLRRDYAGLLRPLDYGQVCPLVFLWARAGDRPGLGVFGVVAQALAAALRPGQRGDFPMGCGPNLRRAGRPGRGGRLRGRRPPDPPCGRPQALLARPSGRLDPARAGNPLVARPQAARSAPGAGGIRPGRPGLLASGGVRGGRGRPGDRLAGVADPASGRAARLDGVFRGDLPGRGWALCDVFEVSGGFSFGGDAGDVGPVVPTARLALGARPLAGRGPYRRPDGLPLRRGAWGELL